MSNASRFGLAVVGPLSLGLLSAAAGDVDPQTAGKSKFNKSRFKERARILARKPNPGVGRDMSDPNRMKGSDGNGSLMIRALHLLA